ncbi:hypothetical protein ADUPG1_011975 [Aduncisulcus paluster]|uniref:Uncharacterized protein n=1 Tax=Aduncisulcus paluster TaxID=2918883 RepID=A0ABQ5K129_9EUKA|nr:hypothetical protein ADUPG1_011975 [Aduncisulcus paluster]
MSYFPPNIRGPSDQSTESSPFSGTDFSFDIPRFEKPSFEAPAASEYSSFPEPSEGSSVYFSQSNSVHSTSNPYSFVSRPHYDHLGQRGPYYDSYNAIPERFYAPRYSPSFYRPRMPQIMHSFYAPVPPRHEYSYSYGHPPISERHISSTDLPSKPLSSQPPNLSKLPDRHCRSLKDLSSYPKPNFFYVLEDCPTHAIAVKWDGLKTLHPRQFVRFLLGGHGHYQEHATVSKDYLEKKEWIKELTRDDILLENQEKDDRPFSFPSKFLNCTCGGCGLPPYSISSILTHFISDDILIISFQSHSVALSAYTWLSSHVVSGAISVCESIKSDDGEKVKRTIPQNVSIFYCLPVSESDVGRAVTRTVPSYSKSSIPDPETGRIIFKDHTCSCRDGFSLSNIGRLVLFGVSMKYSCAQLTEMFAPYQVKGVREPPTKPGVVPSHRNVFLEFSDRRYVIKACIELNKPFSEFGDLVSSIKGMDFGHPGGKLSRCLMQIPSFKPLQGPYYTPWLIQTSDPKDEDYDISSDRIILSRKRYISQLLPSFECEEKKEEGEEGKDLHTKELEKVYAPLFAQWIDGILSKKEQFINP